MISPVKTKSKDHLPPRRRFTVRARNHCIELGEQTKIMGIVNLTPDSFSTDGCLSRSKKTTVAKASRLAQKMIKEGADIIDLGGESSRPGSRRISVDEELDRVIPALSHLVKKFDIPFSVDTYKSAVAERALDAGASIINTIKGVLPDKRLLKKVKDYSAAIVLMHMQGTPQTMQINPCYTQITAEIIESLRNSIENCLEIGIKSDKIIIDPGMGFGKSVDHNLTILNQLNAFGELNFPLLIGTSRKSFIGRILNKDVKNRLLGTATSVAASILKGAHIVRVHDVAAMKDVVTLTDAILNT